MLSRESNSRYIIWQESPIAAVLEAVTGSRLSESPGGADTLGIAIRRTKVESRGQSTFVTTATNVDAKVDCVSVGHRDALGCCEGARGVGLALRLGVGDFGSKEPLDLGFAIADAAAAGGVFAYGTVTIAIEGDFLRAIRVPLFVLVSDCRFRSMFATYYEFLIGHRIDTS